MQEWVSRNRGIEASGASRESDDKPLVRIQPTGKWGSIDLRDLWTYRELLVFLAWRDIKVRYKQTALGASWAILQPFCTMVVFSLFFGKLGKMPSDGIPYPIFTYTALVPWTFFQNGLNQGGNSLVLSANLLKKVYFPRIIIPIATMVAGLVDFALAFIVLIGMIIHFHIYPNVQIVWFPLFLVLAFVSSLGVGLWLSAMNVKYRDIRFIIPFLTQMWLFATPIAYPSSLMAHKYRVIYAVNPMVGVVEGFRWCLLGRGHFPSATVTTSTIVSIVLLLSGLVYFRRTEKTFADIV